jgi:hypothetical protein
MNKKAVVVASCLLASMPIFSKGLIKEKLMKSKHQSFVENSNNSTEFSGVWIGPCNMVQDTLALKITQTDKYIILSGAGSDNMTEDGLKFPFNRVKSKIASSSNGTKHSLSSALWSGPSSIDLSFYEIAIGASDHTTNSSTTSWEVTLTLKKNGQLKFSADNIPEDLVCILDKQG